MIEEGQKKLGTLNLGGTVERRRAFAASET